MIMIGFLKNEYVASDGCLTFQICFMLIETKALCNIDYIIEIEVNLDLAMTKTFQEA